MASATLVSAGDFYEGVTAPPVSEPFRAPAVGGGGFFIGGGVDYLFESELEGFDPGDIYYTGQLGYDFGNGSSIYLEGGFLRGNDRFQVPGGSIESDSDVIPVTLNYKIEFKVTEQLGFYVGAGAGVAFTRIDIDGRDANGDFNLFASSDEVFAAQAVAGVTFNVSDYVEIYAQARYLYTDDIDTGAGKIDGFSNLGVGGGIRLTF